MRHIALHLIWDKCKIMKKIKKRKAKDQQNINKEVEK